MQSGTWLQTRRINAVNYKQIIIYMSKFYNVNCKLYTIIIYETMVVFDVLLISSKQIHKHKFLSHKHQRTNDMILSINNIDLPCQIIWNDYRKHCVFVARSQEALVFTSIVEHFYFSSSVKGDILPLCFENFISSYHRWCWYLFDI